MDTVCPLLAAACHTISEGHFSTEPIMHKLGRLSFHFQILESSYKESAILANYLSIIKSSSEDPENENQNDSSLDENSISKEKISELVNSMLDDIDKIGVKEQKKSGVKYFPRIKIDNLSFSDNSSESFYKNMINFVNSGNQKRLNNMSSGLGGSQSDGNSSVLSNFKIFKPCKIT